MYTKHLLKTEVNLSPNLVLAAKVLQLPGPDLEQLIWREMIDNPALELSNDGHFGDPTPTPESQVDIALGRFNGELENAVEQLPAFISAIDQLEAQVRLIASGKTLDVATYLLQSLDEHGYLSASVEEFAAELDISVEEIENGLAVLHELDPPGIGARNLRECLLIQCSHLEADGNDCHLVRCILTNTWDEFIHRKWDQAAAKLKLPVSDIKEAHQFIARHLCPYPLGTIDTSPLRQEYLHQPDLVIYREPPEDQMLFRLEIPGAEAWDLRINDCFDGALRAERNTGSASTNNGWAWIASHMERARIFIAALNQRWATLRRIGQYLVEYQAEFLRQGPRSLKRITRTEVAMALGFHESTVSRAVAGKIVQLPGGRVIPLSEIFDASLPVRELVRHVLAQASYPLSDREVVDHLKSEGVILARRTVTKYRQQLKLLPSYYRWT